MHMYVGAKCNTHIMTLIHTIYGEREMQYLHDNLRMHIICGAKCNAHIMTLIHINGRGKCNNLHDTLKTHYTWGQNAILALWP
jgi:hypothetical protein